MNRLIRWRVLDPQTCGGITIPISLYGDPITHYTNLSYDPAKYYRYGLVVWRVSLFSPPQEWSTRHNDGPPHESARHWNDRPPTFYFYRGENSDTIWTQLPTLNRRHWQPPWAVLLSLNQKAYNFAIKMHYSNQTSNILGSARTQVYLIESNFKYIIPILSHENLSDRGSYRKFGESRMQESENLWNRGRSLKTTHFANSTLKNRKFQSKYHLLN